MGAQAVPGMQPLKIDIKLRQIYADNIVTGKQIRGGESLRQSVIAIKKIAEQLENGTGPWDMKPMLLNGPKARMGKNGKYNIIPFRHGTSGSYAPKYYKYKLFTEEQREQLWIYREESGEKYIGNFKIKVKDEESEESNLPTLSNTSILPINSSLNSLFSTN